MSGLSKFDYERLADWMVNPARKTANTAFTEGVARDAARAFEQYLSAKYHKDGFKSYVQIGRFFISRLDDRSVWICVAGDGEGGQFSDKDLILALEKFYGEHF